MPAHHQLVQNHSDDGTQEWGKDGHQEPVVLMTVGEKQFHHINRFITRLSDGLVLRLTYVKTMLPQPAMAVKRRGPRSLAGFTA